MVGGFYTWWWRLFGDTRPLVRYLAERFPRWAAPAVRVRTIGHLVAGNPLQMLTGILAVVAAAEIGFWCGYSVGVAIWAVTEVVLHVAHGRGGHRALLWIAGWREAWRVRRRWPADWAIVAAKTSRVQAEVGSSKEPVAPARLRPIADHPKMSWWPRIDWPVASWWVGPPPGTLVRCAGGGVRPSRSKYLPLRGCGRRLQPGI